MGLVLLRLIKIGVVNLVLLGVFVISSGQASPTAQTIPLFGVSAERLAEDGIYAYPSDGKERITKDAAMVFAKGESLREDRIKDLMVVYLKLPYLKFDGLAWVVRWDVDGQESMWPGDSQLPAGQKYLYSFALSFLDANTGAFLLSFEESTLAE